jgi:DNA-binding transcriptional LysR family regulator
LAVCEELNFTRAARRWGVSQPSLSNAISALEQNLGGALFLRRPSTALTGLGRAIRPYLEEIARNADRAHEAAQALALRPADVPAHQAAHSPGASFDFWEDVNADRNPRVGPQEKAARDVE